MIEYVFTTGLLTLKYAALSVTFTNIYEGSGRNIQGNETQLETMRVGLAIIQEAGEY